MPQRVNISVEAYLADVECKIILLEAEEFKFNPYHDPMNGRFTFAPGGIHSIEKYYSRQQTYHNVEKIKTPLQTGYTLERSKIYNDMNKSMMEGNPKRRTNFFAAAAEETSLNSLGGAELDGMLTGGVLSPLSGQSTLILNDLGGRLYTQVNRPAYEALYDGFPVVGIPQNIRGQALDHAMVHKEQSFVQDYLNRMSPANRQTFIDDITSTLLAFGTQSQRKVIGKIGINKFDFGNQSHREAIGFDAVDRARIKNNEENKK